MVPHEPSPVPECAPRALSPPGYTSRCPQPSEGQPRGAGSPPGSRLQTRSVRRVCTKNTPDRRDEVRDGLPGLFLGRTRFPEDEASAGPPRRSRRPSSEPRAMSPECRVGPRRSPQQSARKWDTVAPVTPTACGCNAAETCAGTLHRHVSPRGTAPSLDWLRWGGSGARAGGVAHTAGGEFPDPSRGPQCGSPN